ncbi:checkpoint protein HUS1 [Prorops nasuta]|uniref:checkpoint protein HUS1 n=1 Tax=Prorops nasuta TaxID=863751 RepID=UPI0034CD1880
MKLRCRMTDIEAMRDFISIVTIISRLSRNCVMRFTKNEVCFRAGHSKPPTAWAELSQYHYFMEYTMCGVTEEQNEIYLECDAAMISQSLNSLRTSARSVKIKLTNKQQPCLTFDIELPSSTMEARQCIHDVPVRVIPRREWPEFQKPDTPEFDISIDMPNLKHIRKIVERMKNMSPHLIVTAEKNGTLILKIDADNASVATHFHRLHVWTSSQNAEIENISATVDVKKFLMLLGWDLVHPQNVKCNIIQNKMVNLLFSLDQHLRIYHFVPVINL